MKLRTIVRGSKVHEVGYRFFLFTRATELGCERFFARNQLENGDQLVISLIEGDPQQIEDFKNFAKANRPEGSEVLRIAFEDYEGPVMSVDSFLHFFAADQLSKGIPALLRIDRKQDQMLDKQDQMLDKQDQMLDKQDQMLDKQDQMLDKQDQMLDKQDKLIVKLDETRSEIIDELRASRDAISSKLDENREAIIDAMGEHKESLDDRLKRIENDISKLKSKVGLES